MSTWQHFSPTVSVSSRHFFGGAIAAVAAATAVACSDVSGNRDSVLSIEFDSLASPSVVLGDTLRDTTGVVARPVVRLFNFKGDEVPATNVRFQSGDRGVRVDSLTGIVTADSLRTTPARVIASVGSLQAVQRIAVTLRPETVRAVNGRDSLLYSLIDSTLNVSPQLTVKVAHGPNPPDSAVTSYVVSFAIVSGQSSQLAELVNDVGRQSRVDTTDAGGIAGRAVRVRPVFLGAHTDSVLIDATVKYRGQQVSGSPVRLVLRVRPRS